MNLGLIGFGAISRAHVAAARDAGDRVHLMAVADPADQARKAAAEIVGDSVFASTEELLDHIGDQLDAVVVCTPPSMRLEIIEQALKRGVAVLAEKPLAHTAEIARRLVQVAGAYPSIPTAVAYCHRFVPAVREIRRRLEAGDLGTPLRVENVFAGWNPMMKDRWMSDPQVSGGGSFLDTGCHSLDLFQYLIGPAQVEAAVFHQRWTGRGDSNATVMVTSNGHIRPELANLIGKHRVTGLISSGWVEPTRFSLEVVGTEGLMRYDYEQPEVLLHQPSEGPAQQIKVESHEVRFTHQMFAFADLVSDPTTQTDLAGFAEAFQVSDLADKAMSSGLIDRSRVRPSSCFA